MNVYNLFYYSVISRSISSDCLAVTFKNGESLLLSLFNPRLLYLRRTTKSNNILQQSFVQNDKILQISENHMVIKTVYEHFLDGDT